MKNPIQVYEKIRDNFILYIETAFGTRYKSFENDRRELFLRDKTFSRAPWVEPLPSYKASEFKIEEIDSLPNMNPDEIAIFKSIAKSGLVGNYKLHEHQYEMLKKAMDGNHCVITSGTGSGKTESFLLPLFAYLSKEMNKWKKNPNPVNNSKWWWDDGWGPQKIVGNGNTSFKVEVQQRPTPNRAPAVRAMLIYPMNALVEDQLARLRKALDSDDARDIFKSDDLNNNRIYFGRYNSTSPVSGKLYKIDSTGAIIPNSSKITQLKKELRMIEENNIELTKFINQMPVDTEPEIKKNLVSNFQRLDGAEIRTRFDMQETPPDIMITNFSMLSTMLMRDIENPIFDKTRDWLNCETEFDSFLDKDEKEKEKKERIFHIIIDELHLYRGGSGSEIAYLIRMLLERIGLAPDNPKLRILASSASLEGEEGKNFLKSFFGTVETEFEIINGREAEIEINDNEFLLPTNVFEFVGNKSIEIEKSIRNLRIEDVPDFVNKFINNGVDWGKDLFDYLKTNNSGINNSLYTAFNVESRTRAVPAYKNGEADNTSGVKFISEVLFGENEKENCSAVKGFLYSLGLLERLNKTHEFPRMRFHLFFKNIPGLWGELIPDNEIDQRGRPVGDLIPTSTITYNGRRALELLYCENCGILALGGSRIKYINENGGFETELIPLSPNIEGVPENAPSIIVEKRRYNEFGIFCPGTFTNTVIDWKHPNTSLDGSWEDAWLNIYSGKLVSTDPVHPESFVKGKWFRIFSRHNDIADNQDNKIAKKASALPCICPFCEADYSHPMKKRQSPFRGFRTGFGKVSQIFSTELFDCLPEGDLTKKLVAFSDSREDAAKLAKNIEEEHYNSLLKQVLIHNITQDLQIENAIIKCIENNVVDLKNYYSTDYPNKYDEIDGIITKAGRGREEAITQLSALKENIKHINVFKELVIREFLKFGINPAGPAKSLEKFISNNISQPWHYFFDLNNREYDKTKAGWVDVERTIDEKIEDILSTHIFGKLFYSFEASGLGYASIINKESINNGAAQLGINPEILLQICCSFMRIWGDNYKHNRTEYTPAIYQDFRSLPTNRKERKYIKEVSKKHRITDENDLGNVVFSILTANSHRGLIEINNLNIKIVAPENKVYKCEFCGNVHLHPSGGICTFCCKQLPIESTDTAKSLWAKSYLTDKLLNEYKPFRLHTEELTGQTDDQLLRQRQFKNIFLNTNDKNTQQIDLLSVTTTLEVGVDIGSLQAILLANMPPQRFNYQQRVGRTGRRGQLFSYSLTLARGKSHDDYYFENPLSITGDKPPQPFLSLDQIRIFKRMLAKSVLRFAFKELGMNNGSVHGEFGDINIFSAPDLQNLIEDRIDKDILKIFNSLNVGIYKDNKIHLFDYSAVRSWLLELPIIITNKLDEQGLINGDLSEFLAEVGILPMAGMPTRIRNLIHGFKKISENGNNTEFESLSIDRDLELAIYEFAPGAQKTKDKGVFQSIGFTPNITGIRKNYANGGILSPIVMDEDAFSQRKWLVQDETKNIVSYPYLGNELTLGKPLEEDGKTIFIGASPAAFRTDFGHPKDSNEDYEMNFSKPLTFAESATAKVEERNGNFIIRYSEQELTWKINNNGGDQFTGRYIEQQKYGATFENQWIASDFIKSSYTILQPEETLSLATNKVTEIFRLEPQQLPLTIDINPFSREKFKAASSRGAFYSAAFLLQRTLAADLDIDPEEIEIAAIELLKLPELDGVSDRVSASIVLADELPNGSGFINQLYRKFANYTENNLIDGYLKMCIDPSDNDKYNFSILSHQHINECYDSCYKDLKNYRNMNFHALLDWRLGVGLLRVISDKNYTSGLKNEDYQHAEISNWLQFTEKLSREFEKSFTNIESSKFGKLSGFVIEQEYKVIIVHPFWNYSSHQPEENILTEAIAEAGLENLYFIDSFNLHRRPGWCYGELINMISN